MAFYAVRGITPEQIRDMSLIDRAILRFGRIRYYNDMFDIIRRAVNLGIVDSFGDAKGV